MVSTCKRENICPNKTDLYDQYKQSFTKSRQCRVHCRSLELLIYDCVFYHLIQSIRLALIVNMSMYKIAVHDSEVLRLQIYLSLLCGVTNIGMCLDKFPLRLFEWEQSIITIAKVKLCDILSFTNSVLHRHFKYLMPLVVSAFVNVHITSLTMIL